jgi:BirA family biotin operon repressor/biotin-[acetyl-CoA-carboxylase] ligase
VIGTPHHHFETIGSTNACARELAEEGAPPGTVVTSAEQTEGRGRQGRAWTTPAGKALAWSAIVPLEGEVPGLFPLRAGLAACEAVEELGGEPAEVKWPNDVMLGGRKCAGVLVEGRPQAGWAVVGIGMNLSIEEDEFPPEIRERATSIGSGATLESATEALNRALTRWLSEPDKEVLAELERRDHLSGREINWEGGTGIASGIAPDGALIVTSSDGTSHRLHAGEVHLTSTS